MACVAHQVLAAPFSSIGSIGVKTQTINFDKLAERWGISVTSFTAGKFIASPLTPNYGKYCPSWLKRLPPSYSPEGKYKNLMPMLGAGGKRNRHEKEKEREKVQQTIDGVLKEFQKHVMTHRPDVKVDEVATGEVWLGVEAKEKKLIDDVMTSEEYLQSLMSSRDVILVKQHEGGSRLLSRLPNPVFPGRKFRSLMTATIATIGRHLSHYCQLLLEDNFGSDLLAYADQLRGDGGCGEGCDIVTILARQLRLSSWET